jgi:hypothetical protein
MGNRAAAGRRCAVIERWLMEVRDHPKRPPALQRHVLTMLALRMDWYTGRGSATVKTLMADADASKNTVKRATKWARDAGLVVQTRRGHRISAEVTVPSEWQLTQGLTPGTLASTQGPNGRDPRSQPGPPIKSPNNQEGGRRARTSARPAPYPPAKNFSDNKPSYAPRFPTCPQCGIQRRVLDANGICATCNIGGAQ